MVKSGDSDAVTVAAHAEAQYASSCRPTSDCTMFCLSVHSCLLTHLCHNKQPCHIKYSFYDDMCKTNLMKNDFIVKSVPFTEKVY